MPLLMLHKDKHGSVMMGNRTDFSVRMMEFFNHHLKSNEGPDWLKNRIDRLKLPDRLENRAF